MSNNELEQRHQEADKLMVATPYRYAKPDVDVVGKGIVKLSRGEIIRGQVQVVKNEGGENNLHFHSRVETFWWVIKGRVRFYGKGDVPVAECGPGEGMITPRYSRYWFENCGEGDLELLQIAASDGQNHENGRVDLAARRRTIATKDDGLAGSIASNARSPRR